MLRKTYPLTYSAKGRSMSHRADKRRCPRPGELTDIRLVSSFQPASFTFLRILYDFHPSFCLPPAGLWVKSISNLQEIKAVVPRVGRTKNKIPSLQSWGSRSVRFLIFIANHSYKGVRCGDFNPIGYPLDPRCYGDSTTDSLRFASVDLEVEITDD